ncbi:MAG: hypothetical protein K2X55_07600 [Burkholderiaceae bacterium]|nr:hypothetical protein [Burkholderiaceae bacterium]
MEPVIEVKEGVRYVILDWFSNEPRAGCRMGQVDNLLASAWLDLHTDEEADYDETNRFQIITPYYVNEADQPALIHTVNGALVKAKPLRVGETVIVDLLSPHALVPQRFANAIVEQQTDRFSDFLTWWDEAAGGKATPVLVWSTAVAPGTQLFPR